MDIETYTDEEIRRFVNDQDFPDSLIMELITVIITEQKNHDQAKLGYKLVRSQRAHLAYAIGTLIQKAFPSSEKEVSPTT
jgi:hypothetical protein